MACSPPRRAPAHVVVVLVDQLRQDCFDRWAVATGALARRGAVLDGMRSVAPWTYPSVVSLLSGLLPQQHGAGGFGKSRTLTVFAPEVPLVHGLLRDAGWHTAAFVTNPFLREWNPFHRGFEHFDAEFVRNTGNRRPDFDEFGIPERMFADSVNRAVREHYEGRPVDRPEFTYVHYIDAHGPWDGAPFAPDYESAVRYVDARVAELHAFFHRRTEGRLLFVVTSDHGMALGDDTRIGEGPRFREMKASLHGFNVRVPFAVLPGEGVAAGIRATAPASGIDLAPTILELAGVASTVPLPGRSLLPWIRGGAPPPGDRPVYMRVASFGSCSDAMLSGGRKYLRFRDCATGEVVHRAIHDLESDPREAHSLGGDFGEREAELDRLAGDGGVRFDAGTEPLEGELEERLRALGYVG